MEHLDQQNLEPIDCLQANGKSSGYQWRNFRAIGEVDDYAARLHSVHIERQSVTVSTYRCCVNQGRVVVGGEFGQRDERQAEEGLSSRPRSRLGLGVTSALVKSSAAATRDGSTGYDDCAPHD